MVLPTDCLNTKLQVSRWPWRQSEHNYTSLPPGRGSNCKVGQGYDRTFRRLNDHAIVSHGLFRPTSDMITIYTLPIYVPLPYLSLW